jgi:hypothetical protein
MADSFVEENVSETPVNAGTDVEMAEGGEATPADATGAEAAAASGDLPFAEEGPEDAPPPRVSFIQYLTSPVVTLLVGSGDNETILTAHQSLLVQSPFFAEACAEFANDGSVSQSLEPQSSLR